MKGNRGAMLAVVRRCKAVIKAKTIADMQERKAKKAAQASTPPNPKDPTP